MGMDDGRDDPGCDISQRAPGERFPELLLRVLSDFRERAPHGDADGTVRIRSRGVWPEEGVITDSVVNLGEGDLGGGPRQAVATFPTFRRFDDPGTGQGGKHATNAGRVGVDAPREETARCRPRRMRQNHERVNRDRKSSSRHEVGPSE